ncbi:hypothetical protein QL285_005641 [Trifolium repens]|nr:hypothetical protein QL285_033975 [Trifolium repens]KAK2458493.1 hypothetical protein QL285_005641 [Trifolium repens]
MIRNRKNRKRKNRKKAEKGKSRSLTTPSSKTRSSSSSSLPPPSPIKIRHHRMPSTTAPSKNMLCRCISTTQVISSEKDLLCRFHHLRFPFC